MKTESPESSATITFKGDNQIDIQGELNFDTVPVVMRKAKTMLDSLDRVFVSFAGVRDSNSAGLALLLEMARYMRSHNKAVYFQDVPQQLHNVAHAYGIEAELAARLDSQDFHSL